MQGPTWGDGKDASNTWEEDTNGDFGRGGAAGMMRSSIEKISSLCKERKCARKYLSSL